MTLSVYDAVVPTFLQMLGSLDGLVTKAEKHCQEAGLPESDILEAALAPDMFNFAVQINQVLAHSSRALALVQEGLFTPDQSPPAKDFASLHGAIQTAIDAIKALDEDTVNGIVGKPMRFEFGDYKLNFVAEEFLLTFSQPNFFFHLTTAYAILRAKGLKVGKGHYMGAMRIVS